MTRKYLRYRLTENPVLADQTIHGLQVEVVEVLIVLRNNFGTEVYIELCGTDPCRRFVAVATQRFPGLVELLDSGEATDLRYIPTKVSVSS